MTLVSGISRVTFFSRVDLDALRPRRARMLCTTRVRAGLIISTREVPPVFAAPPLSTPALRLVQMWNGETTGYYYPDPLSLYVIIISLFQDFLLLSYQSSMTSGLGNIVSPCYRHVHRIDTLGELDMYYSSFKERPRGACA
jgi:hypothetical protein